MEIKKVVDVFVPLMYGVEYESYFGDYKKAIKELIGLSGIIQISSNKEPISKLEIKKLNIKNKEVRDLFKKEYSTKSQLIFLKFSSRIEIINTDDFDRKVEHFISFEYFVKHFIIHLLIYSNIAKPGAFDSRGGIIRIQEILKESKIKFDNFPILENSISHALVLSSKYKWPPIKELSIKTTLGWLEQHWNAFESISENKIQRALNAFSYLFHEDIHNDANSIGDLFHALVGIEAIYVVGTNNIQDQVNHKSQVLLGPRRDFKKVFNELYDYRSRYVHGQLNFINKFWSDNLHDIAVEQFLNTYDHSAFAISILVSSLQKHIELNKNEFVFELILKND